MIGLAFHSFHDANKRLPYNGTPEPYVEKGEKRGGPAVATFFTTGSWAFGLTAFEQATVFSELATYGIAHFMCPGRGRPSMYGGVGGPGAWSDYAINPFLNDPNGRGDFRSARLTFVGITDGTSNTIMIGHAQMRPEDYSRSDVTLGFNDIIFKGGSPGLCRSNTVNSRDSADSVPGNWGSPFAQGSLMCMADATVRMFPYSITGGVIRDGKVPDEHQRRVATEDFGDGRGSVPTAFATWLTPCGDERVVIPDS